MSFISVTIQSLHKNWCPEKIKNGCVLPMENKKFRCLDTSNNEKNYICEFKKNFALGD
jgi:hypothetical protein